MATATKGKQQFRVYKCDDRLLKAIRSKRDANGVSNAEFLGLAVSQGLPHVVDALHRVGLSMGRGKAKKVKWPVDSELLGCLRVASKQTGGIPASRLLMAALAVVVSKGTK
jgi:hypothetical protein